MLLLLITQHVNTVLYDFVDFVSTNREPKQNRILVSVITVLCFTLAIYIISAILKRLRKVNLLNLKRYSIVNGVLWLVGAVLVNCVLLITRIIEYNIVSFLFIAMVWDIIYQRIFKQAKRDELGEMESIERKTIN